MKDQSTCTMLRPTHDLTCAWKVQTTVGRVWGACWDAGFFCIFTLVANASWFSDVWQRDDALGARWGCSSFSGQHARRGGQTCFKQCSVTSIALNELPSIAWISSWRFLKPASLVLFRCLASASSVGWVESAFSMLSCPIQITLPYLYFFLARLL